MESNNRQVPKTKLPSAPPQPTATTPATVDPADQAERADTAPAASASKQADSAGQGEIGGPKGLEPTRYGDWESKGRCIDF